MITIFDYVKFFIPLDGEKNEVNAEKNVPIVFMRVDRKYAHETEK